MGITLVILMVISIVIIRLAYRGATYRPTRLSHVGDVTVVTPARNAFQTGHNQIAIKKTLNHALDEGSHELIVDLSRVEPSSDSGSFDPLNSFLTHQMRDESMHVALVCPSAAVKRSYPLRPLPQDVPVVNTLDEALAGLAH